VQYDYDVAIVGYGPVSQAAALMLARQGRKVGIFERWKTRYPLPRAVCIDHEMFRMMTALGLGEQLRRVTHPAPKYRWFNAQWQELLCIDWSVESISGGPEVNFLHQPTFEAMLDSVIQDLPNVHVHTGHEVVAAGQDTDHAWVDVRNADRAQTQRHRARYVIGADGANSLVRKTIGSTQEDLGFEADWLVIDILPNDDAQLSIPPAAQYCNPQRPTTIVPAGIRDGRYYRRWEFMRLPGETVADLEDEALAWQLLKPWVRPDQAHMVRHKVYTFRSLLADQWRDRRLLLIGDAAHVMPPFMGQGMCAGLRDAWNLAWKLAWILDGRSDDALLDTCMRERRPHVRTIIELSMYLGKIICTPDAHVAAERDAAFLNGTAPPPPPFPWLTDGLIAMDDQGKPLPLAGCLSPHGHIRHRDEQGRFDDVIGGGFVLITRDARAEQAVAHAPLVQQLPIHVVSLGDGTDGFADSDGKYGTFMDEHNVCAMLVRPDFYIYAACRDPADTGSLVQRLAADLGRYGLSR